MKQDFVENIRWRGLIHDISAGAEDCLKKEKVTGYIGFDLTATSLHIGNLVPIMLLKHLQNCGHRPIALLGGATSLIGDPSGKSAERKFLSEDEIMHNQECIKEQLCHFLDFGKNGALLLNNLDWFADTSFLKFLREVGKHISVSYMLAKDSVKNRLESGISFTEFSYQLMQAYDFYYLNKNYNVKLQMGGADQWGNLTTGTELIRRKTGNEVFLVTAPLITKSDGQKFGKSESGNIWLDPKMTSPYSFYQFWMNCSDEDARKLIYIYSMLGKCDIESLLEKHNKTPEKRILQQTIANELTTVVHSQKACNDAIKTSEILFYNFADIACLTEQDFETVSKNIPKICVNKSLLSEPLNILDLVSSVTRSEIFNSKNEARRSIIGGALSINKIKITDPNENIHLKVMQNKYMLVQKGKNALYIVVFD